MKKLKMNLDELRITSFITEKKDLQGKQGGGTIGSCTFFVCEPSNPYPCDGNDSSNDPFNPSFAGN